MPPRWNHWRSSDAEAARPSVARPSGRAIHIEKSKYRRECDFGRIAEA